MARKQKEKKPVNVKREILGWIGALVVALIAVYLIHTFLFMMIRVEGRSMVDTLQDGDRIASTVIDMRLNGPERGKIVLCKYAGNDYFCVKRVIGMPGDTLEIKDGKTAIDGKLIDETYVTYIDYGDYYGPVTLGADEYFVMGDNRANSHDSRSSDVGALSAAQIIANPRLRLWPLDRIGLVE